MFLLNLISVVCANEIIHSCQVHFKINDQSYSAYYDINLNDGNLSATYKSPFNNEIIETFNIKKIVYDEELIKQYFIGAYKEQISNIGQFDGDKVHQIIQYGIDMNGNSAKAQILVFYDENTSEIAKVVYPSYYPMKCSL